MTARRLIAAAIGLAGTAVLLTACEPSPKDQFVQWCQKYDSSVARCECIGKKVSEDLTKEQFAQLMTAAKADTNPSGSFSDLMGVVTKAIGDGRAAVSLTAAAMTCQ